MSNSIKVGLTGNFLSGMDTVVVIFRRYKIPIFDCDLMVKYLLYNSEEHIEKVRNVFGDEVFDNGVIDLTKFEGYDENTGDLKFHVLMKLLEFDILRFYEKWRLKHNKAPYTIFKSQILFEFGFHTMMNLNITCFKPIKFRAQELHDYYNMDIDDAYKMLEQEMGETFKHNFAQYTIYNYDNWHVRTEEQISIIHKSIKNKTTNPVIQPGSAAEYVE